MIISTTQELRLHIPSNAIDEISSLQGILDNSEKDFLRDKLGCSLYDRLCEFYLTISPDDFYISVCNGEHTHHPWQRLLLYAQRMVVFDAIARFAYQQAISINGVGVNVASSNDYENVSKDLLDKGVQGYRREAMASLNQLLVMLEDWAKGCVKKQASDVQKTTESVLNTDNSVPKTDESVQTAEIEEITNLWKESTYYYLHHDLLIATCADLQHYLDIYESREKFIRLLPDLHYIQEEYIADAIGEDTLKHLLTSTDASDELLLRKTRRLMVAYLEERTSVLTIDKTRRQRAHDESISLRASIMRLMEKRKAENAPATNNTPSSTSTNEEQGYPNNQPGSKMFVSPLLY